MIPALSGRTVLVTRPRHQAAALSRAIREAGGEAWEFPALQIEAVPPEALIAAHDALPAAEIMIFISPNAARYGVAALRAAGHALPDGAVFAVGPGTAQALRAEGVADVITPAGYDSEAVLALPQLQAVAGKRVTLVRGVGGRALLADTLRARGADVRFLECYRRTCPRADATALLRRWHGGGIDAVTVASAETLHNLASMLGEAGRPVLLRTPLFAPHDKIAEAARQFGIADVVATAGGDAGLVAGLINWFRNTR